MPSRRRGARVVLSLVVWLGCSGCGLLGKEYEYEEELYLGTDGSATLYVNASTASLVALHGVAIDPDPRARPDRGEVRSLFAAPGVEVGRISFFRRAGRRFVHARVDAAHVGDLQRVAPLAWSTYRFSRSGESLVFEQVVGRPTSGKAAGGHPWTGSELVAFRLHAPSKVLFQNAPDGLQRGNILAWEQPLSDRLAGVPLALRVEMESTSILSSTLLLFGSTIAAAAAAFAVVIWLVARRGRRTRTHTEARGHGDARRPHLAHAAGGPPAEGRRQGSSDAGITSALGNSGEHS